MGIYAASNVSASTQLTSVLTHVRQLTITDKTATGGQIRLTEVSGTGRSWIHDTPGAGGAYTIDFPDEGFRFQSGVSVLVPTSVVVNVIFERGA